jgi:hypothetical protein
VNVDLLELAAAHLGPLCSEVVFIGGATTTLWITDPAAPPERPTEDVDVIVDISSRLELDELRMRLEDRGLDPDVESGVTCRFRHRHTRLAVDVMPTDGRLLGFTNRWYGAAIKYAVTRTLPSGTEIRATPPVYVLATKIEAFKGRGGGDFVASRDFGDIVAMIVGREEIVDDIGS